MQRCSEDYTTEKVVECVFRTIPSKYSDEFGFASEVVKERHVVNPLLPCVTCPDVAKPDSDVSGYLAFRHANSRHHSSAFSFQLTFTL